MDAVATVPEELAQGWRVIAASWRMERAWKKAV